jgi:hypothetical protein
MGAIMSEKKQVGTQLNADLYLQARMRALAEGRNVGELIDDAIRAYLEKVALPKVEFKRTKGGSK